MSTEARPAMKHQFCDVEYANDNGRSLKLDIYLPEQPLTSIPVVLWVHGGGWQNGDKQSAPHEVLCARGFAVVGVEYRLSGEAIWPTALHDLKAAIRWVRANAWKYFLDPNRIGAWGASAGGHLVAMLGVTGDMPDMDGNYGPTGYSTALQAVCNWCGPTDLSRVKEPHWRVIRQQTIEEVIEKFMGGPWDQIAEQMRNASPVTYIHPFCPPIQTVHGLDDDVVHPMNARVFHEALVRAGVQSQLLLLEHTGHSVSSDETRELACRFFERNLVG